MPRAAVTLAELRTRIGELALPAGDWVLSGSAPLLAHGLVDAIGDIDIVARGAAWERARERAPGGVEQGRWDRRLRLPGGVEVFDGWLGRPAAESIDDADLRFGLAFVRLERTLAWKRTLDRPKDRDHVARLEAYLARR